MPNSGGYYYPSGQHPSNFPQNPARKEQVLRQSTQYIAGGLHSSPGQLIPSGQKLSPPNFTQPGQRYAPRMLMDYSQSNQNPQPPDSRFLNVAGETIIIKNNTHEDVERKLIELLERTNRKLNSVVKKRNDALELVRKAETELIDITKMMDVSNTHVEEILVVWKQLVNNEIPLKDSNPVDYRNEYNIRPNANYQNTAVPYQNSNSYSNHQAQPYYQTECYNGPQNEYCNSNPVPHFDPNVQMTTSSNYIYSNMATQVPNYSDPVYPNYSAQTYQPKYDQRCNTNANSYNYLQNAPHYGQPMSSANPHQVPVEMREAPAINPDPTLLTPRSSTEGADSVAATESTRSVPQTPHQNSQNEEVPLHLVTDSVLDNSEITTSDTVVDTGTTETETLEQTPTEIVTSGSSSSSSSPPVVVSQSSTPSVSIKNNCRSYAEAVASGISNTASLSSSIPEVSRDKKDGVNVQNGISKLPQIQEVVLVPINEIDTIEPVAESSAPENKRSEELSQPEQAKKDFLLLHTVAQVEVAQPEPVEKDLQLINVVAATDQQLVNETSEGLVIQEGQDVLPELATSLNSSGESYSKKEVVPEVRVSPVVEQEEREKDELVVITSADSEKQEKDVVNPIVSLPEEELPKETDHPSTSRQVPLPSRGKPSSSKSKTSKTKKKKKVHKKLKTPVSEELSLLEMEEEDKFRAAKNKVTTQIKFYLASQPALRSEKMIDLPFGTNKMIENIIGFVNGTSLFFENEYIRLLNSYQNSKATSKEDRVFFLAMLEQSSDKEYTKVIQQDTSFLRMDGEPGKMKKYIEAVTGFMSSICKKTVEEYLECQVFRRNLNNTPPVQKLSEIEYKLMKAAREDTDFHKNRFDTAKVFLQQRKQYLEKKMVRSQLSAAFLICYETLEAIDNPVHVSIVNFDFDYLSNLPNDQLEAKEAEYLSMFFSRFLQPK